MKSSKYLFSFFMLFVLFADEIFYSYLAFRGIEVESGMKARMALLISGITYPLMLVDLIMGKFTRRNVRELVILGFILFLYFLTGLHYTQANANYESYLLLYGSYCIPAAYIGMRFARDMDLTAVNNLLPYFVIPLTLIIGFTMRSYLIMGNLVYGDESGLNYQSVSYYLSYFYAYCVYYCFFSEVSHKGIYKSLVYFAMLATMFLSAALCLMGGGRGAFVYIIFISAYLVWSMYRSKRNNRWQITIAILTIALVFIILADRVKIFDSVGISRVTQQLTEDDVRRDLWKSALQYFYESPFIGWGLGSIWWTVGFYSHNIVTDLLAETGIVGTGIVLYVLGLIFFRLYYLYKNDKRAIFIILVFLGKLVQVMFSGYWIAAYQLFFTFGFVFAINWNNLLKTKRQ